MDLQKRIESFVLLGEHVSRFLSGNIRNKDLENAIKNATRENPWFTPENTRFALAAISAMISGDRLKAWLKPYDLRAVRNKKTSKKIGVIMPANIPMAGFHDFLCVLMSGNIFFGKCSAQDKVLLPALADLLISIEPGFKDRILFTSGKLTSIDAIIATGSNNTARYFEYYFDKYPNIIRKNRNSVAVLTGKESAEELKSLGNDMMHYFGLGCRNISKLFIPEGFDFSRIFEAIYSINEIIHHNKYANNYTFYKAVYLMNKINIWDNGFLILKEDPLFASPVSVVYYEYYNDEKELFDYLAENEQNIQCIAAQIDLPGSLKKIKVAFGKTQHPELWDYADRVDTLEFLMRLQ